MVERLASIQCSYEEMAAVLDCNPSTLTRRFAQAIEKGRAQGRMSLKRKQFEVAMDGNTTMLIWLGKQHLDQKDKHEVERTTEHRHILEPISYDELRDAVTKDAFLEIKPVTALPEAEKIPKE